MNVSRCARNRVCVRSCALIIFLLLFADLSVAQITTTTYNGLPAVADEVLIRLRTTDSAALARVRSALPVALFENLSQSLALHRVRVPGLNVPILIDILSRLPEVQYAEPNYILRSVDTVPDDPLYPLLWGMVKIGAPSAWGITTGNTSTVVGVVDSGIDYNHPDLIANLWSAPSAFTVTIAGNPITCPAGSHGFNAINRSCNPFDDFLHGTHVSGTIGAVGNNTTGVAGVNWSTR